MLKSNIKITCRPYNGNSKTKAFIELCLDDILVIKGMTLIEGKNGLFLSMPSSKGKDGKYYDSVYSLDKDFFKSLQDACIKRYEDCIKSSDTGYQFS